MELKVIEKPWITGPKELLVHGLQHLQLKTDFDNRIAMISIDNSVELMIKTYLGLPKRISKIEGLSRKSLEDIISSFPSLLDGLEKYAGAKLNGIDLGDIEWFHRLRNQLYHEGNGITVEKEKVEAYAEIAKMLFENLFDLRIQENESEFSNHSLVGEFIKLWADLERRANGTGVDLGPIFHRIRLMVKNGRLSELQAEKFDSARKIRNELVHGMSSPSESELSLAIQDLKKIKAALELSGS